MRCLYPSSCCANFVVQRSRKLPLPYKPPPRHRIGLRPNKASGSMPKLLGKRAMARPIAVGVLGLDGHLGTLEICLFLASTSTRARTVDRGISSHLVLDMGSVLQDDQTKGSTLESGRVCLAPV